MSVIGLDLSLAATGWAVASKKKGLIDSGVWKTNSKWLLDERINTIMLRIMDVARETHLAAIEEPILHRQHPTGALSIFQLHGAVRWWLHAHGIAQLRVNPRRLKSAVAGNGGATKKTMIRAVQVRWKPDVTDHNEADAIGLAMMGLENDAG